MNSVLELLLVDEFGCRGRLISFPDDISESLDLAVMEHREGLARAPALGKLVVSHDAVQGLGTLGLPQMRELEQQCLLFVQDFGAGVLVDGLQHLQAVLVLLFEKAGLGDHQQCKGVGYVLVGAPVVLVVDVDEIPRVHECLVPKFLPGIISHYYSLLLSLCNCQPTQPTL